MNRGWLLLGLLAAGPLVAEEPAFSADLIVACLASEVPSVACIGLGARACIEQTGYGSTGVCLGAESAFWQERISTLETALSSSAQARADRATHRGMEAPDVEALSAAHAQYRRVACDFAVAQWEGMMTGPQEVACEMRLNAHHALMLERWRDG